MMTLQLRIGGTLLAALRCGQQTFDFIEEGERWANLRHSHIRKKRPQEPSRTFADAERLRDRNRAHHRGHPSTSLRAGRGTHRGSLKMLQLWAHRRHPIAHDRSVRCVRGYEAHFIERGAAAVGYVQGEHVQYRDLQKAGVRTSCAAKVESGRGSSGRSSGARRSVQGGVCVSLGALWVLELGVARRESSVGYVWGKLHD